jgi:hypothetical protein
MRTIIVFNDNSPEAENAAEFALYVAQKVKADLLILNLCGAAIRSISQTEMALKGSDTEAEPSENTLVDHLCDLNAVSDFKPVIGDIDASDFTVKDISTLVISKNIWLMVKGIQTEKVTPDTLNDIDIQAVLNRVACPLLIVPDRYKGQGFENIAYTVDMRYCRVYVIRFLLEMARAFDANLVVEHLSAKGLAPLEDKYAESLFKSIVTDKLHYDKLYFNNIKERNLNVAIDLMVNGLHADLLVMVNHRFHFEEIFGQGIRNVLPDHIPVPVMVFPC